MAMYGFGVYAVLLCARSVLGATTSTTYPTTSSEPSTCPFRTINYLTHTLPAQCLTSPRRGSSSTVSSHSHVITTTETFNLTTTTSSPSSEAPISHQAPSSESETTHTEELASTSSSGPTVIESVTTFAATQLASTTAVPLLPSAADEDSPLESGNFLSFEEWKKQNLIKAGQSEHVGRNARAEQREPRKRAGNTHNTLDSLGDDAEIDLDFSGLVPGGPDTVTELLGKQSGQDGGDEDSGSGPRASARGKDAGTTSKERFNYASVDCAANVLKTNPEAKSPNTVIMENKDSYMLNKCSAKTKFIILELCDDISIDTIVLANFEFFSSSFRTFRVSVSDKYPVRIEKWKSLGIFEARNTREVQAFLVENPIIWARYVRIEFLSHYGNEFYCPVSLIRVHGTTMMEEYKHDLAINMGDDDDDGEDANATESEEKDVSTTLYDTSPTAEHEAVVDEDSRAQPDEILRSPSASCPLCSTNETETQASNVNMSPNEVSAVHEVLLADEVCSSSNSPLCAHLQEVRADFVPDSTITPPIASSTPHEKVDTKSATASESKHPPGHSSPHDQSRGPTSSTAKQSSSATANSGADTKRSPTSVAPHSKNNSAASESHRSQSGRQSVSATQPQPASPTMQESFFKSVQKRLQMLESNSSLSLQYIEEQSKALRDAFRKVEQRQLSKTSLFLDHLNQTVLNELREFRQQYDHLWQSTVIELELQRERYEKESQAMHARLGVLADELIFQRRVSMLQMMLILICLGLILFSRGAINNYLELPLVQSVLSRSPSSKWTSPAPESRTTTPAMARPRSSHQFELKQGILKNHVRSLSEDSNNEALSASEMYSPPTPVSYDGFSDAEVIRTDHKVEDPEFDPINLERPSTSPPVLPSIEDPTTPRRLHYTDDISIESRLLSLSPSPSPSPDQLRGPEVKVEQPTPPGRHLTWDLPD